MAFEYRRQFGLYFIARDDLAQCLTRQPSDDAFDEGRVLFALDHLH